MGCLLMAVALVALVAAPFVLTVVILVPIWRNASAEVDPEWKK